MCDDCCKEAFSHPALCERCNWHPQGCGKLDLFFNSDAVVPPPTPWHHVCDPRAQTGCTVCQECCLPFLKDQNDCDYCVMEYCLPSPSPTPSPIPTPTPFPTPSPTPTPYSAPLICSGGSDCTSCRDCCQNVFLNLAHSFCVDCHTTECGSVCAGNNYPHASLFPANCSLVRLVSFF